MKPIQLSNLLTGNKRINITGLLCVFCGTLYPNETLDGNIVCSRCKEYKGMTQTYNAPCGHTVAVVDTQCPECYLDLEQFGNSWKQV